MKLSSTFKSFTKQINQIANSFMAKDLSGKTKGIWLQLGRKLNWFNYTQEYPRGPYHYEKSEWPQKIPEWLLNREHLLLLNIIGTNHIFMKVLLSSGDNKIPLNRIRQKLDIWSKYNIIKLLVELGLLNSYARSKPLSGNHTIIQRLRNLSEDTSSNQQVNCWIFPLSSKYSQIALSPLQELYVTLIDAWLRQYWTESLLWDDHGIFQISQLHLKNILEYYKKKSHITLKIDLQHLRNSTYPEVSFESSRRARKTDYYVIIRPPKLEKLR